ncbi:MAG: phage tail protein, partial [Devosia sp.]|nr:phage tail protein [Devosia sp.]
MAGRKASNNITRYAGIQVQTSALGLNIPVGWGTFRCKCNLVDYLDFKATAQTSSGGGKGGSSTTTGYSYSATVILALCEGPIDAITTVYVNSKVYTNGSTTALAQAGLSLSTGAVGQAVWSYLTSNHPDHAIGYSGLAICYASNYALDSGASTPNHSFEVVRTASFGVSGTPDADPSLVVADFFTNPRTGVPSWASGLLGSLTQYQNYCLAAGLLVSPVIDAQRSASDFLTELLLATNSTCVWSEGLLKFIPYGDTALTGNGKTYTPNTTPVYALNDDDYVVDAAGDPPLQVDIMDQSDAYNVVQLEYLDRSNQYNMAIALASDAANIAQYGMRRKDPDTVHCICTPTVAALSAQLFLQRTLYVRAQYKFKLGWMFAILEPGDIL